MSEQEKAGLAPPRLVGVREFRGNLLGFMRQVRAGASFLVTSRGEAVALVQPPPPPLQPRQPGTLSGKIHMAPDFDVLPAEILDVMEKGGV